LTLFPQFSKTMTFKFCASRSRVDFINVLRTTFAPVTPQSVRTHSSCQYLFKLSGSMSIKAVSRMLMKLTLEREAQNLKVIVLENWGNKVKRRFEIYFLFL